MNLPGPVPLSSSGTKDEMMDSLPPPPRKKPGLLIFFAGLIIALIFLVLGFSIGKLGVSSPQSVEPTTYLDEGELGYYSSAQFSAPLLKGTVLCYNVIFNGGEGNVAIIDAQQHEIVVVYAENAIGCYAVPFTGQWYFFVANTDWNTLHYKYVLKIYAP